MMSKILFVFAAVTIPLLWGVLVEITFERYRRKREKNSGDRDWDRHSEDGARADDWII